MLLWLFAGGVVLRLFYIVEHASSPFFRVPILDEAFYDSVAKALAAGEPVSAVNPAFRPLFYPALLSLFYRFGDWGLPLALGAQHLLGILTALLIAVLSMRLYGRAAAGAIAGSLYLLAGPPLFFEGELLIATVFTALGAALLWMLSRAGVDASPWSWVMAGITLGVMASARSNALILVLAVPIAALLLPGSASRLRRLLLASAALVALVATLILGALWQREPLGRFQLVAGGGGVNLYLGNKQGADGMVPRQDRHQSYGDVYRDSVQLFAFAVYQEETGDESRPPAAGHVSRFWLGKAIDEIRADPAAWLGLMVKKSVLLGWNREIPNNKSFAFIAGEESQILGFLPVRFWLLLALGGVGVAALLARPPTWQLSDAQRSLAFWLGLYVLLLGGAVVLYFVNARYRLPLWPALAIFAGGGGLALVDLVRSRLADRRRAAVFAAVFVFLSALSLVNWFSVPPITPHRDYFFRSLAHSLKGQTEAALSDAQRSVELEPTDAAAHFQVAAMALQLERNELAERHALAAVSLEPKEPRVLNQLGIVLERQGKLFDAYRAYLRATENGRGFSAAWVNAALLELRAGEIERAAGRIEHAEKLGDRSVALQCARAFLELKRGRVEFGKALLRGAIERDRRVAERLVREYEQPLRLLWGDFSRGDRLPSEKAPPEKTPSEKAPSPTGR